MPGRSIPDEELDERWNSWSPVEVAERLTGVTTPWCIAAGWALELFSAAASRDHDDIEITVPADGFVEISVAFPEFEWDIAGDGQVWPYPEMMSEYFQTWLREPRSGEYKVDVFREPHVGRQWLCRRDQSITMPYDELILRTSDGIPYLIPEVVLLFKAKHLRGKDELDFQRILPDLDLTRRSRLRRWLEQVHPDHSWVEQLSR